MSRPPLTLITGASSGIGRELAIRLSPSRALLIHGRDEERLQETLSLCEPGEHHVWSFNFSDLTHLRSELSELLGALDVSIGEFIHSAGIPSVGGARMMSSRDMQTTFNVNTFAALEICATLLRKVNHGRLRNVLFVSSIWARYGSPGHTVYSASKAALDAAMRSLAVELAPEIRVNSVALGAINTPMAQRALSDPEIYAHTVRNYPLGIGDTADAAGVIEFLLSESAKWITGQVLVVDGGRTSHMSNK